MTDLHQRFNQSPNSPRDERSNAELDAEMLASEARQGERAIAAIHTFLGRFVSYPSEHARVAHTLWIAHTHLMAHWDSTPRLAFLSAEPASGKTRALEITELLVPHPVATVNVSPAYLFRKVGSGDGATILYDEIDTVFGPRAKDNEDIRGLLNAGHRRGATTGRCVMRGNDVLLEELPAYSAVALAGIGWLPDTILSRSVIIRMKRRHAGEKVEPFRRRIHVCDGRRIYDQVASWAQSVSPGAWPDLPPEIVDRNADIWEPLIAVADMAGGDWPRRARDAGVALVADGKEAEPSLGIKLLNDLRAVFGAAGEMPSKAILQALHAIEEAPWADLKGKPIDERSLSHRLRQYGVRPKVVRVGASTPRGYARSDLADVWARYLPSLPTSAPPSDNVLAPPNWEYDSKRKSAYQINHVADVADVAHSAGMQRVCAHCEKPEGVLSEASIAGTAIWLHATCMDSYTRKPR